MNQRTATARVAPVTVASLVVVMSMIVAACATTGSTPPGAPPPISATDTSVVDFTAGAPSGAAITNVTGGELELARLQEEFSGAAVPAGWTSTPWNAGGGVAVAGGSASVDGALLATNTTFHAGQSLEFVATFGGAQFQNLGFGQTLADPSQYWAMFGRGGTSDTVFARTNLNGSMEEVAIPGSYVGGAHTYRIGWSATSVEYRIDGTLVHTATATIPVPLRVVASDYNVDGSTVTVSSASLSGYGSAGTFDSRVIDGGATVQWTSLGWDSTLPAGTSVQFSARAGGTPAPNGTWTAWSAPSTTPGAIALSGRYVQYRIGLATTDNQVTPVIRSVTLTASTNVPPPPVEGPGGPVLLVTSASDPFDRYYAEILRAEGLNAFAMADVSGVTPAMLGSYDAVLLAANGLTAAQTTMFTTWVTGGGDLVAMRPDAQLASLLGLAVAPGDLTNAYLRIDPASTAGAGLVHDTIQFKGTADRYSALAGTSTLATLFADATTPTPDPAVTLRSVGANGGTATVFTYDLARAVVLLRQGNPAWIDQNRDGEAGPHRPNDLFFGAATGDVQPDWVDLTKVAIPQADEQQRLLANLLVDVTRDQAPLPRFWYLPRGEKAAIVLTGDEHNGGDPKARINSEIAASPPSCAVSGWECVRSTVYLYPDLAPSSLTAAEAASFSGQGFEIALHTNTGCQTYDRAQYGVALDGQLPQFASRLPGVPAPVTNRNHCIMWSGWSVVPEEEAARGIRLDTNYYFWPPPWVSDTPGLFTGSGFPMRFARADGSSIDVYQAATQMTDESGQSYPSTAIALMERALGTEGYYGTFVTNLHTDNGGSGAVDAAVVAAAQARGVPLISAAQLLEWVDGRNASTFDDLTWSGAGRTLSFSIGTAAGATGLEAMLPLAAGGGTLNALTRNGSPVVWRTETIKGIAYAIFTAASGPYVASYTP